MYSNSKIDLNGSNRMDFEGANKFSERREKREAFRGAAPTVQFAVKQRSLQFKNSTVEEGATIQS